MTPRSESRRPVLWAFLLLASGWSLTESPRRSDLFFYGMGGSLTALVDHPLMNYYNPAALALSGRSSGRFEKAVEDDLWLRPRVRTRVEVGLPGIQVRLPLALQTAASNLMNAIDVFSSLQGSLLPSPLDQIFAQLGLGSLFTVPNQFDLASAGSGLFTNAAFTNAMAGLRNVSIPLGFEIELLRITAPNFSFRLDALTDIAVGTPASRGLLPFLPLPVVKIQNDVIAHVAAATAFPTAIPMSVGVGFKVFGRLAVIADTDDKVFGLLADPTAPVTSLAGALNGAALLGGGSLGAASNYLKAGWGAGVDAGFLVEPLPRFTAGLCVRDAFTLMTWVGAGSEVLVPAFDVGTAWRPRVSLGGFFEDPIFSLGLFDALGRSGNSFGQRVAVGMEFGTLFDAVRLRVGLYQGWLAMSGLLEFNIRFLSKVPVVKLLFPKEFFWPLLLPEKWDYAGLMDYVRRNPVVFVAGWALRFVSLFDFDVEAGYFNQPRLSALADWQGVLSLRARMKL